MKLLVPRNQIHVNLGSQLRIQLGDKLRVELDGQIREVIGSRFGPLGNRFGNCLTDILRDTLYREPYYEDQKSDADTAL